MNQEQWNFPDSVDASSGAEAAHRIRYCAMPEMLETTAHRVDQALPAFSTAALAVGGVQLSRIFLRGSFSGK